MHLSKSSSNFSQLSGWVRYMSSGSSFLPASVTARQQFLHFFSRSESVVNTQYTMFRAMPP